MKKVALCMVLLLVLAGLSLIVNARSVAVCRQSLYPSLFWEYQHCPTDQVSDYNPPPPTECIISENPIQLTVGESKIISIECPGKECEGTTWEILQNGELYTGDPPKVEIMPLNDFSANIISSQDFELSEGFSLQVSVTNPRVSCEAGIESFPAGAVDDYYDLSLTTDKEVYRLLEDSQINVEFLVTVIGGVSGNVELTYFFKNTDGNYIITPTSAIVAYENGKGIFPVPLPINPIDTPVGIYQIGGELPIKDGEKHTSNNRAQKFVTILEQNREVNIPETTPLLVVLVAFSVILLIERPKKQLN